MPLALWPLGVLASSPPLPTSWSRQAEDARQMKIASPVLNARELSAIRDMPEFKTITLSTVFALEKGPGGLKVGGGGSDSRPVFV